MRKSLQHRRDERHEKSARGGKKLLDSGVHSKMHTDRCMNSQHTLPPVWRVALSAALLGWSLMASPISYAQTSARMPAFDLEMLNGTRLSSRTLSGKVAIIDFWATWCKPCLAEIPAFNALHSEYRDKGVVMLGIVTQSGWASDVKPDVERLKIAYPVVIGDDKVEKGFGGVWGFPTTFIVDQQGRIVKKFTGQDPNKRALIEAELQKLLGAKS